MFSSELFEKIIQTWEADQNHLGRARTKRPLPDISDVRAVTEAAFWASLKREEGQAITFALVLLPKDIKTEQGHPLPSQILRFNKSLPLNVESVTKLAMAFQVKQGPVRLVFRRAARPMPRPSRCALQLSRGLPTTLLRSAAPNHR